MSYYKHETAIVDDGAIIGDESRIWHWVHISAKAKIGERCSFGQNVFVGNNVVIGNNCKIQNNVSIYENVFLEDDVFCGPSMVFTNVVNPRAAVIRKDEYLETKVKKGATIGANATIVCGVTLGEYSFVAAGAVVINDVRPYALMAGVPAVQKGWMSRYGIKIPLDLNGSGEWICLQSKEKYILDNGKIIYAGLA